MPIEKRTIWIAVGFGVLLIVAILIATGAISLTKKIAKAELAVWGFDSPAVWEKITKKYHVDHPTVTITYRALSPATYETDLLNGLATGKGPDIFMIMNPWLSRHGDKMVPAPIESASAAMVDATFPTAVTQELTNAGVAYALPLYMDTYALIYNKDLFDKAGVTLPPVNWLALQDLAKKLGKNSVALGGSETTIEGASDILALLMMQDNVPLTDKDGKARLTGGEGALSFYTKFTNPKGGYYAWDNKIPTAFERFARGTLPMLIGTHAEVVALRKANPSLRIGTAPLPQAPSAPVNFATYAALSVWVGSNHPNEGWQFVSDIAANAENALVYATSANVPPAMRSLIGQFENDPEVGVFVRQSLTARPWYRLNEGIAREAFSNMIESVTSGAATPQAAIRATEDYLNR
ncbi:MAG: extracellular solute-binding protein [Candidatus Pacebacteria bacterium]|nr:extracellular solute-binding protein [Candidatus Paceibacterota bacterium]